MKIETLDGKTIETEKLPDIAAELIEKVENSDIRNFVKNHNGMCYVLTAIPPNNRWITTHIKNKEDMEYLIENVSDLLSSITNNKFKLIVVPNE